MGEGHGDKKAIGARTGKNNPKVKVISSKLSYEGPLFRVYTDKIVENGRELSRDVVRHNGSVVILAIDDTQSKRDPMIVVERQYRHAAKKYLLEVPAGKMEEGEDALAGAKRELMEETGLSSEAMAEDGTLLRQPRLPRRVYAGLYRRESDRREKPSRSMTSKSKFK